MSSQQKDIESSDEEHDFIVEKKTVDVSNQETVNASTEETVNSTEETVNASTEETSQKQVIKNATVFNTVESEDSSDSEYEEIIIRKKVKKKSKRKKSKKNNENKLQNDHNVKLRDFVNQLEHVNMFDFHIEPLGQ